MFPVISYNALDHTLVHGEQFRGQMFLAITSGREVVECFGPGAGSDAPELAMDHLRLGLQAARLRLDLVQNEDGRRICAVSVSQMEVRVAAAEKLIAGGVRAYTAVALSNNTALYGIQYDPQFYVN